MADEQTPNQPSPDAALTPSGDASVGEPSERELELVLVATRLVLVGARRLIATRASWTRAAMARDSKGRAVALTSLSAVRWCLAGALLRSAEDAGLGEPAAVYDGSGGADPPRLGVTATAFALVVAGGLAVKDFCPGLASSAVRSWMAEEPNVAVWSAAAQLLHNDRIMEPSGEPPLSPLLRLAFVFNDTKPASHRYALAALDRAVAALQSAWQTYRAESSGEETGR